MRDAKIRAIVERDYVEIQRAFVAQCWKSTIILASAAIEAVLTDILVAKEQAARAAISAGRVPVRVEIEDGAFSRV